MAMKEYLNNIKLIETDLQNYSETDYESETKDYEINLQIKNSLAKLLRNATNDLNGTDYEIIKEKILLAFTNHTGCVEDIEVFEKVIEGLITDEEKSSVLSISATSRWS